MYIIFIIQVLYANLRKLVYSNIDLSVIGLYNIPILNKISELFDEIICDSKYPIEICSLVQEIFNSSQSILYSDKKMYKEKMEKQLENCSVVEIQFRWPVQIKENENEEQYDYRYDVVLCNLQTYCEEKNINYKLYGSFSSYIYLIFELPKDSKKIIDEMSEIVNNNNIQPFSFYNGSEESGIFVQIEHFPSFNRKIREEYEPGNGIIRVYPKGRCTINNLEEYIQKYLNTKSKN